MVEYDQRSTAGEVMCMHVVYRGSHDVQDLGRWGMEAYAHPPHDRGVVQHLAHLSYIFNPERTSYAIAMTQGAQRREWSLARMYASTQTSNEQFFLQQGMHIGHATSGVSESVMSPVMPV